MSLWNVGRILDGDVAMEPAVGGAINFAHAALSELGVLR
jgi:hypothetical protein